MDKPEGPTSSAVVRRIRAVSDGERCGHVGTLDPFATGLLPVLLGRATRLARFVAAGVKGYEARVRFGWATDTDDRSGTRIGEERAPPDGSEVAAALPEFLGARRQRPPRFSAKRAGGARAYRLARAGVEVRLQPVEVIVRRLEMLDYRDGVARIACEVGPGTYIRALARDLGERLGSGAHLAGLRRTRVGPFPVDEAAPLDAFRTGEDVERRLLDPVETLRGLPRLPVSEEQARRLGNGLPLPAAEVPDPGPAPPEEAGEGDRRLAAVLRLGDGGLRLVAVVAGDDAGFRPVVGWSGP